MHLCDQGSHPVLKLAIVVVRHEQISDSVDSIFTKVLTPQLKITHIGWLEAFNYVLLDAPRGRHNAIYQFMLDEEADDFALST